MMESDLQPQEPWKYMKIVEIFTWELWENSRIFQPDFINFSEADTEKWAGNLDAFSVNQTWFLGENGSMWYNELMHKNRTKEAVGAYFSAD